MPKLGVNIDHIATVREARKTYEPDPVKAAIESLKAGCDSIVCHLRKDRRHINDADLKRLKEAVPSKLNLEMSCDPEIVEIACRVKPDQATLVPENRREVTTEGGLDVAGSIKKTRDVIARLRDAGIQVSLFIDPEKLQVEAAKSAGARIIELHTGRYAEKFHSKGGPDKELDVLRKMTRLGAGEGLIVCAGHGLNYENTRPVAEIDKMYELNIGHSIVSRAVFVGMYEAVGEMMRLIR